MLIFGPNLLSVSERAYLDDQRTCFRLGGTINLPSPISQYPPSCAGPKTASTEFNCLDAVDWEKEGNEKVSTKNKSARDRFIP